MVEQRTELWTPSGLEYVQSWFVGKSEGGMEVVKHEFKLTFMGQIKFFGVAAESDISDAHIEDAAAVMAEGAMREIMGTIRERGRKLTPEEMALPENRDVRRDFAATLRDFRAYAKKRRESTTGKLYFAGVN